MRTIGDLEKRLKLANARLVSTGPDGFNGFIDSCSEAGLSLRIQFSDGGGWEHASVTVWKIKAEKRTITEANLVERTPTWAEMCQVKDVLWHENEWCCQFHPSAKEYINCHPTCLHIFRPTRGIQQTPPSILIGPKGSNEKKH